MIIQIIMAAIGSLGFSLLFRLRPEHLPLAALGGALTWGAYLLMIEETADIFVASVVASIFCALFAEIVSKVQKTPATVLLIPSIIPLIPGRTLYYTMIGVVEKDFDSAIFYGKLTIQYGIAIALGIAVVWTVWAALFQRRPINDIKKTNEGENV